MFSRELRWCHKCWLIRSLCLCSKTAYATLSLGQTIARCQCNISEHCWAQHVACVWPPCCNMLGVVGSNLTIFKPEPTTRNTHTTCCPQQCGDMLRCHVAIVWSVFSLIYLPYGAFEGVIFRGRELLFCWNPLKTRELAMFVKRHIREARLR